MLRSPASLPTVFQLLDDLKLPVPVLARHLGVGERTFWQWKAAGVMPRPAAIALFWESSWGQSLADTTVHNGAMYARQELRFARVQIQRLEARVARLERLADFGSANAPVLHIR